MARLALGHLIGKAAAWQRVVSALDGCGGTHYLPTLDLTDTFTKNRHMIDHHAALIYMMVLVSAADRNMTDAEMLTIGEIVQYLPIFSDFDDERLPQVAGDCAALLDDDEGLDRTLKVIRDALPKRLHETAYALACDVAAADGKVGQEELRLLEIIRYGLDLDRLTAAAIERGARARHTVL